MCLAVPARLVERDERLGRAIADLHGTRVPISTALVPEAQIGDWVISSLDREQSVLFTRVRGAGLNTAALSTAMARRRRAQQQEYTGQDLLELRRA